MRAVKSVSIDSERRVIITYLDGSTETLYPNCIWCDSEALRQLIKDLLEEKADAITQTIENVTIATFADGADEGLIKKLLVSIDPIQEGTGDPSPDNVRPISGRTGLTVVRSGKNLLDTRTVSSGKGLTITKNADGSIHVTGKPTAKWFDFSSAYHHYIPAGSYILSLQSEIPCNFVLTSFYEGKINIFTNVIKNGQKSKAVSFESNVDRIFIGLTALNTSTAYDFTVYPQLELGSTATDYEPYKGNTYSVNWQTKAGTVYGGTLDVVSGKLIVDRANIESYNGEELPSTWLSDRDVYAEGTTPTTGAQVVYELSTPIEYQLTPQEISTLLGVNNIWADSGNILELEYNADTKLYIGEQQSGTSGTLGSNMHTITIPDLQPVTDNTLEETTRSKKYPKR